MKIIYFTKYSRKGASSRLRSYQYFALLEKNGYTVKCFNLFNDLYLEKLYSKKNTKFIIILCYFKRFFQLLTIKKSNIIFIEKELFPYLPVFFEFVLKKLGFKYFVDYDDAIFHNYDMNNNFFINIFLKNKINSVMKHSFCVFAGNSYLAERAKLAGAKKVVILPTVIDLERYKTKKFSKLKDREKIIIGWIGSPSTIKYVEPFMVLFDELINKNKFELQIVGAKLSNYNRNYINYFDWNENTEVEIIKNFDIGIMPLENTVWEKGKCSYKIIQYMACGVPVLASKVGMNIDVIENGIEGFLCDNLLEWKSNFIYFFNNDNLEKFGNKGREKVENNYNTSVNIKILLREFSKKY